MKFVLPNYTILHETDPFLQIEGAGRTCYQSEPKEGDTPEAFFGRLKNKKHFAMVEFAHMVFIISNGDNFRWAKCKECKYLNTTEVDGRRIVSGNIRAINESGIDTLLKAILVFDKKYAPLCYSVSDEFIETDWSDMTVCKVIPEDSLSDYLLTTEEQIAHEYLAVRLQTCRGVTHEIVRNRPFSFAQESTRYVTYGKDGQPMLFMLPPWIKGKDRELLLSKEWGIQDIYDMTNGIFEVPANRRFMVNRVHNEVEYGWFMNEARWQAQQAREDLPNSLKTEIVIKGPFSQWLHFLFLRCDKPAHPQMREWTIPLFNELREERHEIWDSLLERIDITGV